MGKAQRNKGGRIERKIVKLHRDIGIKSERVPLSGASHYQGRNTDVDVYLPNHKTAWSAEVKSRKTGGGFITLERWLADHELLFLHRNNAAPLVVLPWRSWAALLQELIKLRQRTKKTKIGK